MGNRPGVTGGERLDRFIRDTERAQRTRRPTAEIGYWKDRYPDGTPVAFVAMLHEFGSENNVESAAIRRAVRSGSTRAAMIAELRRGFNPRTGRHSPAATRRAAAILAAAISENQPRRTGRLARSVRSRVTP